jgi:hypothetical protein
MRNILTSLAVVMTLASASAAFADVKPYWESKCKAEIEKFKCDKSSDDSIYQCLLKHDVDLSKACDNEAHSIYEKESGKTK